MIVIVMITPLLFIYTMTNQPTRNYLATYRNEQYLKLIDLSFLIQSTNKQILTRENIWLSKWLSMDLGELVEV